MHFGCSVRSGDLSSVVCFTSCLNTFVDSSGCEYCRSKCSPRSMGRSTYVSETTKACAVASFIRLSCASLISSLTLSLSAWEESGVSTLLGMISQTTKPSDCSAFFRAIWNMPVSLLTMLLTSNNKKYIHEYVQKSSK